MRKYLVKAAGILMAAFILAGAGLASVSANAIISTPGSPKDFVMVNDTLTGYKGTNKHVVIPEDLGIKAIDGAFAKNQTIETIVIPEGVTHIANFMECVNLKYVVLPDSLTRIDAGAFLYCKSLESIIIPEGVARIGDATFANCVSLESIRIPDSAVSIDLSAFWGTPWLEVFFNNSPDGLLYMGKVFCGVKGSVPSDLLLLHGTKGIAARASAGLDVKSIIIPDTVENIGMEALAGSGMTSITMPSLPQNSVGLFAFESCKNLTNVTFIPSPHPYQMPPLGGPFGAENLTTLTIPEKDADLSEFSLFEGSTITTIRGYADSAAQKFARENGLIFEVIPDDVSVLPDPDTYPKLPDTPNPPPSVFTPYDFNGDGQITVADVVMLLRHIVGLKEITQEARFAVNLYGGEPDIAGAIKMLRKIVAAQAA